MGKVEYLLNSYSQKLWFLPSLLSLATLLWIGVTYLVDRHVDWSPPFSVDRETLMNLFTILSSTMLTVATFAISAISSAIGGIASSASPRATRIVLEKNRMRSTMAAFLATFIFAVVSITVLSATYLGEIGRQMLFAGFVVLVGWVLIAFLQWVEDITNFGKPEDTIERLHNRACDIVADTSLARHLGCRARGEQGSLENAECLTASRSGCLAHLALPELQGFAERKQGNIYFDARPGDLVHPRVPLIYWRGPELEDEDKKKLMEAVVIEHKDSADQNPRFAMRLLAEIADRALSPGINDPGTAISVISRQIELLELWVANEQDADSHEVRYPRLHLPGVSVLELFRDSFLPIARDGAGHIEVVLSLLKALGNLSSAPHREFRGASRALIEEARELALLALRTGTQKDRVRQAAEEALT